MTGPTTTLDERYSDAAFHHSHGAALVYAVAPEKVLAFGRVPFTHTTYRFGPG